MLDRTAGLLQTQSPPTGLRPLQQRAGRAKRQLEAIDAALFRRLRASIRTGRCRGAIFRNLVDEYVDRCSGSDPVAPVIGYDNLDVFTNGLFPRQAPPSETTARELEVVHYQKTPARIIFEPVEQAQLTSEDVFYEVGSGLGHVPVLANLLSGTTAKGIEAEPAYCAYANGCAVDLNLSRVAFTAADARRVDYSGGTVFFLYTPFEGRILQEVLEMLRAEAQRRSILLFTCGPCTLPASRQHWLTCLNHQKIHLYKLCVFRSFPAG